MKKVLLTKTSLVKPIRAAIPESKIITTTNVKTTTDAVYQQRKSMQNAFQELFRALFQVPDKSVQQRVMDAINGVNYCARCKSRQAQKDAATQTDEGITNKQVNVAHSQYFNGKTEESSKMFSKLVTEQIGTSNGNESALVPLRKKRKRKLCVPQVIKKSHAQQAQHHLQPKMKKQEAPKKIIKNSSVEKSPDKSSNMRARSDSLLSFSSLPDLDSDIESLLTLPPPKNQNEFVLETMANEFVDAEVMQDGLFPLHLTIIRNDFNGLNRQIYIWKTIKKCDLNELVTDEDEDCLQLAIVHNCFPKTIQILLESGGLNVNCIDAHSNTVLHMAILHKIDLASLYLLMRKIDLSLLIKLNDDGYTPLHLAVRNDYYKHAEVLIDVLDEISLGHANYKRYASIEELSQEVDDKKSYFLKFYMIACKQLNARPHVARAKLKVKLLECGDIKSGNTALFYAIENQMEHFIYFLLAHLTDPRVINHSGQDAKSYLGENCKTLNLSLQMDKVMEAVVNVLDQK